MINKLKVKQKQVDAECIQSNDEVEMKEYLRLAPLERRELDSMKPDELKKTQQTARKQALTKKAAMVAFETGKGILNASG